MVLSRLLGRDGRICASPVRASPRAAFFENPIRLDSVFCLCYLFVLRLLNECARDGSEVPCTADSPIPTLAGRTIIKPFLMGIDSDFVKYSLRILDWWDDRFLYLRMKSPFRFLPTYLLVIAALAVFQLYYHLWFPE